MQKLIEVVEIWFVLNLATFAFIAWYRRPRPAIGSGAASRE